MITRTLSALALAMALASPALANDYPPYAGSHDDASYGDIPHAQFGVDLPRPDGVTSVASPADDVSYGTDTAKEASTEDRERMACGCC